MTLRSGALAVLVALAAVMPAGAQSQWEPPADQLDLDASVTADVVPDVATVAMTVVRTGPDVPTLTADVNRVLAKAFVEAKAVPKVIASSAGYSTSVHFDTQNGKSTRNGWDVQAQIVLKSKDPDALGKLVGRLAQALQVAGSSFEVSPELQAQTSAALVDKGIRAFNDRALAATKALGYTRYAIRQVTLADRDREQVIQRPMYKLSMAARAEAPAPLPQEAGPVTLTLVVSGSVRMIR